jgi:hypothetical protein
MKKRGGSQMAPFEELSAQVEALTRRLETLPYSELRARMRPRFLYKFRTLDSSDSTSVDRIRDVIVRSRFWLSSPLDFNDPFDTWAKVVFDGSIQEKRRRLDQVLKQHSLTWNNRQKQLRRTLSKPEEFVAIIRKFYFETIEKTGVYSFGGDPLSILMWSHYASNHRGLCLQFEAAKDPMTFIKAVTIKYSDKYPLWNWTTDFDVGLRIILERKHSGWHYERESRIIISEATHQYIPFLPEALRSIIIGCCTPAKTVAKLRELIQERSAAGFPTPKVYSAFKHDSRYKLLLKNEPNI